MAKQNKENMICAYYENAISTLLPDHFICTKKGMVSATAKCRAFTYDPQKRTVRPRAHDITTLTTDEQ